MIDIFLPLPYIPKNLNYCVPPALFKLGSGSETVEFSKVITLTSTFIPFQGFEVVITGSYSFDDGVDFSLGKPIYSEIQLRLKRVSFPRKILERSIESYLKMNIIAFFQRSVNYTFNYALLGFGLSM